MVGLLDWLGITDPSTSQSAPPPSGGQGLLGSTQAQIPTWDQYNQQRQSFGGLLSGILGHGIGPGIASAMAPDSEAMGAYNALLGQGQTVGIQGIGIPRQQFMADVIAGKRDPSTGALISGDGTSAPLSQQQQPSYVPPVPGASPAIMPASGLGLGGGAGLPNGGTGGQASGYAPTAPAMPAIPGMPGYAPATANAQPSFLGMPLPRTFGPGAARMSLAIDPTGKGLMDVIKQGLTITNVRPGGAAVDSYGNPIYQQPQLPQGQIYQPGANGQPGAAVTIPGANYQHAILQGIDQGAIGARERNVKGFENTLEFGGLGMGGAGGGGPSAGGPAPLSRPSGVPLSAPALPSGKPIVTEQGTTIPPATEQAPTNRAGAYLRDALPEWSRTETAWSAALPALNNADMQMNAIADALKRTQAGSFATDKADIAAKLKAVGIELPASVWGDPAQVQIALKNNAISALNTLKGTTTKFTQMEFDRVSKALANPDLQPEAALSILSESLGQIHSGQAQTNDWATAKRSGWENPIDFQRAWLKANPTQDFVNKAKTQIGPLMGMPGGPQSGGQGKITIGTTASGPNGARVKWDGMKWNPM